MEKKALKTKMINIPCDNIGISIITLAELKYGAHNSKKINENLLRIRKFRDVIQCYNLDEKCIDRYAKIKARLRSKGEIIDDFDILIASTAIEYNCILVTNNVNHFERISNLEIENWKKK